MFCTLCDAVRCAAPDHNGRECHGRLDADGACAYPNRHTGGA